MAATTVNPHAGRSALLIDLHALELDFDDPSEALRRVLAAASPGSHHQLAVGSETQIRTHLAALAKTPVALAPTLATAHTVLLDRARQLAERRFDTVTVAGRLELLARVRELGMSVRWGSATVPTRGECPPREDLCGPPASPAGGHRWSTRLSARFSTRFNTQLGWRAL